MAIVHFRRVPNLSDLTNSYRELAKIIYYVTFREILIDSEDSENASK